MPRGGEGRYDRRVRPVGATASSACQFLCSPIDLHGETLTGTLAGSLSLLSKTRSPQSCRLPSRTSSRGQLSHRRGLLLMPPLRNQLAELPPLGGSLATVVHNTTTTTTHCHRQHSGMRVGPCMNSAAGVAIVLPAGRSSDNDSFDRFVPRAGGGEEL